MNAINSHLGLSMSVSRLYDYPTIRHLTEQLSHGPGPGGEPAGYQRAWSPANGEHGNAVAVIGMAGRFPGGWNPAEFWRNIAAGRSSVSEVPPDRWAVDDFYDPDPGAPGKTYGRWMGALDGADLFDAQFFNISPLEAEWMDPRQRIFLEQCWACVEDAGINPTTLAGSRCGVFVGCRHGDYGRAFDDGHLNAHAYLGESSSILAARISYFLDLKGPSIAVDTACSSSLVAVAEACDSLVLGRSDLALAGGVCLLTSPSMHIMAAKVGMLSKRGRCFAFDMRADGIVPGEGVGVALLKRLPDAIRDGDRIDGVIRGWGVNQDGKTNGITAPSVSSQAGLLREVYQRSGVNPETISLVEAHGTGTALGDPIEVEALATAFRSFTGKEGYCALGSVKSNIGHLLAASGIAGLFKVLLAMRHGQLPRTIHYESLNERIPLEGSPFFIADRLRPWDPADGSPRRAAVSSFGFSGTNAHIVVEQHTASDRDDGARPSRPEVVVPLSARSQARLTAQVEQLLAALSDGELADADLREIAYTLQVGREAMEHRLAVVAVTSQDLRDKLQRVLLGHTDIDGVYRGEAGGDQDSSRDRRKGDDLGEFSDVWIAAEAAETWAKHGGNADFLSWWVTGTEVDWRALHDVDEPNRISVPTYPFERQPFTLQNGRRTLGLPDAAGRPGASQPPLLHPLLREDVADPQAHDYYYTCMLTGRESFLADHVVMGSPVLPAAVYVEMALAALTRAAGMTLGDVALRDVVFLRPLAVQAPITAHIRVWCDEPGQFRFQIFSDGDGNRQAGRSGQARIVHCEGRGVADAAAASPQALDPGELLARCDRTWTGEQCYEAFAASGMCYGPAHRAVRALHQGTDGDGQRFVLADLDMPGAVSAESERYAAHPSLLDGALQSTIALRLDLDGPAPAGTRPGPALPFVIAGFSLLRRCPSRCVVHVRPAASGAPGGQIQGFDVDLCDTAGEVCARITGYTSRAAAREAPGDRVDVILAERCWQAERASGATRVKPIPARHVVVLNAEGGVHADGAAAGAGPWPDNRRRALAAELPGADVIGLWSAERPVARRFTDQSTQLLEIVQGLTRHASAADVLVQVVVPVGGDEDNHASRAFAALLKTARAEHPRLICQLIEIPADASARDLARWLTQSAHRPENAEVRHQRGLRFVAGLRELPGDASCSGPLLWRPDGVYLITGGAGGIGLVVARELLTKAGGATVVLAGRSPLHSSRERELDRLRGSGARIEYLRADVSQARAVDQLVRDMMTRFGALNGVIHAAGIVDDGLLASKRAAGLESVLAAKVAGIVNLDEATRQVELDFFLAFSSVAAVFGNVGQADYALGNAFMDEFCTWRDAAVRRGDRHGRTLSINWCLWSDGGMHVDEASMSRRLERGLAPLSAADGIAALYRAYASGLCQVAVLAGDRRALSTLLAQQGTGSQSPAPLIAAVPAAAVGTDPDLPAAPVDAAPADDDAEFGERVERYLAGVLAEVLKLPAGRVAAEVSFDRYGIDSIVAVRLVRRLESDFGPLAKTLFFEYRSVRELAGFLLGSHPARLAEVAGGAAPAPALALAPGPAEWAAGPGAGAAEGAGAAGRAAGVDGADAAGGAGGAGGALDVAVVGVAGRYPGARDVGEFWEVLRSGRDCVTEIPPARWDHGRYFDERKGIPGKSYGRWGGFIEGVDEFDPLFFSISPREAELMDPQERLFLQCVYHAVEDAGYTPAGLGHRVGVFAGVMYQDYQLFGVENRGADGYVPAGSTPASIANRVSFFFDFRGPSVAVDSMCSSSLSSVHWACQSLLRGECEVAVAGGVNVSVHPNKYVRLAQGRFLSSAGRCGSFGVGGDGYVPGEGVGALVLKPLARAVADGDQVYGVIKGSAVNHGGRATGFTVPNAAAQAEVVAAALARAGIAARQVGYLEAHGTGTALGDPVEIAGLARAFAGHDGACAVGSVKSNIGHCEAAAGAAGLTKVLLQLRHGLLAPSLHARELNPDIDFTGGPFRVQQDLAPWPRPQAPDGTVLPRTAGISSFGAGGSNAHLVVQEYLPAAGPPPAAVAGSSTGVILSARTRDGLAQQARALCQAVQDGRARPLADVAYTLQVGREAMDWRLGVVAASPGELAAHLQVWLADPDAAGIAWGRVPRDTPPAPPAAPPAGPDGGWPDPSQWHQLIRQWVSGAPIAWDQLYTTRQPHRISLPGYPFTPHHHWVRGPVPGPAEPDSDAAAAATAPLGAPATENASERVTLVFASAGQRGPRQDTPVLARPAPDTHLVVVEPALEGPAQKAATLLPAAAVHVFSPVTGTAAERIGSYGWQLLELLRQAGGRSGQTVVQLILADTGGDAVLLSALAGLLRSAAQEEPRLAGQVIRVEPGCAPDDLAQRLRDDAAVPADREIQYRSGERLVAGLAELPPPADPRRPWKDGGRYLITGGMGGLGLILAREIVDTTRGARVILTGRSPHSARTTARLEDLTSGDADVRYLQADTRDPAAVRELVRAITAEHGVLSGVIQCAGIIRDGLLATKKPQDWAEVLAPKTLGTANLDQATAGQPLDLFLICSSVAGVFGNRGQSDYALGNAFQDRYAEYRDELARAGRRSGRTLSVGWPLWADGGMRADEPALERMREQGIHPLPTPDALAALYHAYSAGHAHVTVLHGDRSRLRALVTRWPAGAPAARPGRPRPAVMASGDAGLRERVERYLSGTIADALRMSPAQVEADQEFDRYGVDSIIALQIIAVLETAFGPLPKMLFFEHRDLRALTGYFLAEHRERLERLVPASRTAAPAPAPAAAERAREATVTAAMPHPRSAAASAGSLDVAIIGMSGRYPGARDLAEFWEVLRSGRDCVTEIPPGRWDQARYHDPGKGTPGRSHCRWGGFIDGVDEFDPAFFTISPRDAELMDPQIRLYLQTVWHLLEGAGYTRGALRRRHGGRIGVYVGSMYQQYRDLDGDPNHEAVASLSSYSSIANRVSHFFGLIGPSIAVDTMCSSAFTAIHMACKDLLSGDCQMAIAGAVNLSVHPRKYVGLSQLQMIGSTADSRSFSAGDGYLPSEGVGAVLLKPLDRAIAEGDSIQAVIKGLAASHSGRTSGFGTPDPAAQAQLIRGALDAADVDPRGVGYIEAAATGAALGDAAEVAALAKVFGATHGAGGRLPIGSVKSNLGHGEAVSGMAQLAKVVLQMRHRELAPTILTGPLNPDLQFDETPLHLVTERKEWQPPAGVPRRALINAFGAGGSYACLVVEEYEGLEEYKASAAAIGDDSGEPHIVVLSAPDRERLRAVVGLMIGYLGRGDAGRLADVAHTTQTGREAMDCRLALVVRSLGELREGLAAYLAGGESGAADIDAVPAYSADAVDGRLVASMLSGTAGESAVAALLAEGNLARIAQLWAHGVEIPWQLLHRDREPRLVRLPAYPFRRDQYWIASRPRQEEQETAASAAPACPAEPSAHAQPPPAGAAGPRPDSDARRYITGFVAEALRIPTESIRPDRDLRDYGLDSVTGRRLLRGLSERFQVTLSGRELMEHQTIDQLAGLLAARGAPRGAGAGTGPGAVGPVPRAADEDTVTSEYLDRFLQGLMDLEDVKKMIKRGDFL